MVRTSRARTDGDLPFQAAHSESFRQEVGHCLKHHPTVDWLIGNYVMKEAGGVTAVTVLPVVRCTIYNTVITVHARNARTGLGGCITAALVPLCSIWVSALPIGPHTVLCHRTRATVLYGI